MNTTVALLILGSYLLGSIPFGLIVGRAKGVDPRTAGSGNIGATNVGRLLGKRFFFAVFFLDMAKGLVPMVVAGLVLRGRDADATTYVLWLLAGFAAILGHMFSVFLKFKGGKGVATSSGVLMGLYPYYTYAGLVAVLVFIVVFYATRYVSVGSMLAAAAFPLAYALLGRFVFDWPVFGEQLPLMLFGVLVAVMSIYKHRGNIARLRAGTESRFKQSRSPESMPPPTPGQA